MTRTRQEYERRLRQAGWRHRRSIVMERAGYRCEQCGGTFKLEVHHNSRANNEEFGNERIEDLQLLCKHCHPAKDRARRIEEMGGVPVETKVDDNRDEVFGKVYRTINYAQFSFVKANREVSGAAVDRLVIEIQRKNMLSTNPMIVDRDFNVIDGQHRLSAAMKLREPIYYTFSDDNVTVDDIARMTAQVRSWKLDDFLLRYVREGRAEYVRLNDFIIRWRQAGIKVRVNRAMYLCYFGDAYGLAGKFKNGDYVANDIDFAHRVMFHLSELSNLIPYVDVLQSDAFIQALANLEGQRGYDHHRMMQKLEYQSTLVKRAPSPKAYVEMLSRIYNYKTRERDRYPLAVMNSASANWRVDRKGGALV